MDARLKVPCRCEPLPALRIHRENLEQTDDLLLVLRRNAFTISPYLASAALLAGSPADN